MRRSTYRQSPQIMQRAWLRPTLSMAWASLTVLAGILLIPTAIRSVTAGVEQFRGTEDLQSIRSECSLLDHEIETLIRKSRREKKNLALSTDAQQQATQILAEFGLELLEFSFELAPSRKPTSAGKWRMTAKGEAAAWGACLATMEDRFGGNRIESASWSAQGWTDRELLGELILTFPQGEEE